jgi:lipoyl-dependent peroxiredoxin
VTRRARVAWLTHPPHGTARISVQSGAFSAVALSVPEANPDAHKAAPGELLALTHGVFMAWALSEALAMAGTPANELTVRAECTFAGPVTARELVAVALAVYGIVPGVDAATFAEAADDAQRRYLRSAGVRMDIPSELSAVLAASGYSKGSTVADPPVGERPTRLKVSGERG